MSLCILNGRVIDPANGIDKVTDLYIEHGKILALGEAPADFIPEQSIDAGHQIVMPGIVDMSASLREPGQEFKATIASETRAAASSGITSLCCPPDTDPPVDTPAEVKLIQQRATEAGHCRVYVTGALTEKLQGESLNELASMKQAGCVGVTNSLRPVASTLVLRRAMEYASSQSLTLFLYAMDHDLGNNGCAHEGAIATRLGLTGIPTAAETAAVGQIIALVEQIGVRTHICRLSSARAARMVARAIHDGLPVSADVCAHQLYLTHNDIQDFNSLCHTLPPLRSESDRDILRQCLAEGTISALCSDHQPHEIDAKQAPFPSTEPGISALETLLPLSLGLVSDGVLDMVSLVSRLTHGPATILGINAGTLGIGKPADICIVDANISWTLTLDNMLSAGHNTPFLNRSFTGCVTHTILEGRIVYSNEASDPG